MRASIAAQAGGGAEKLSIDEIVGLGVQKSNDIIALDDALKALARSTNARRSDRTAVLRRAECGRDRVALGVSPATVGREQRLAEAWLHRELSNEE
jgi:hypothetical protein